LGVIVATMRKNSCTGLGEGTRQTGQLQALPPNRSEMQFMMFARWGSTML
jgi:hypothetical protein